MGYTEGDQIAAVREHVGLSLYDCTRATDCLDTGGRPHGANLAPMDLILSENLN